MLILHSLALLNLYLVALCFAGEMTACCWLSTKARLLLPLQSQSLSFLCSLYVLASTSRRIRNRKGKNRLSALSHDLRGKASKFPRSWNEETRQTKHLAFQALILRCGWWESQGPSLVFLERYMPWNSGHGRCWVARGKQRILVPTEQVFIGARGHTASSQHPLQMLMRGRSR